jgi:hypothetical protein
MPRVLVTAVSFVLLSGSAFAQSDQSATITKMVAYCVNMVHKTKLSADEAFMARFYRNFDAFYNPSSGRVENSARLQGDEKPLFIFNKCMSERGFPLTYGPQTSAIQAACDDQELAERNGDCWIKLSPGEKRLVEAAFLSGGLAEFDIVEQQLYSREAMNPATPLFPDNLTAAFDALYAVPENRTISFADASDLTLRQERVPDNPEIGFLQEMYRNHEEPMLSGYLQKFLPPNKLVIARWNDSADGKMLSQRYGDQTETITMLGIASTTASAPFTNFMNALVNIKACHTLMAQADALSHMKYPVPDATRKGMRDSYSSELGVVVRYPNETDSDIGPQFFNGKGELSADILLDATDQVCDRPDESSGVTPVTLGELMVNKQRQSQFAPALSTPVNKFISLNAYVLSNGLQAADDTKDPRPAAEYYYPKEKQPVPDAVATVLRVGSVN